MKSLRLFMILTLVVLLSACNTATQVTKVQKNGETTLKIGSLQGYYDVQTLKAEKGNVEIPYEAAVEEGTILLQVTKEDKVIYEEEITSQKEGLLSFEASKSGSYDLIVRVKGEKEKAKEIQIHTKL
ncbi:BA_1872 family lipoprotein [Bacillus cereus group sp. MYBK106-1]|uniref:BA_1872 family lipoprotein n=1 Tax=unclassified Bacillus cereus group TaxID=2750818 RepID=UPI003F7A3A71